MTMTTAQVLYIGYLKKILKYVKTDDERAEILEKLKEVENEE